MTFFTKKVNTISKLTAFIKLHIAKMSIIKSMPLLFFPYSHLTHCLVNIKWGKESFKDIEVDLQGSSDDFRAQLFSLTNVPPERQKGILHYFFTLLNLMLI